MTATSELKFLEEAVAFIYSLPDLVKHMIYILRKYIFIKGPEAQCTFYDADVIFWFLFHLI